MTVIHVSFPTKFERVTLNILEDFTDLLALYLSRTLRDVETRCMSRAQLHAELTLYLSTGFAEWVSNYCDEDTVMEIWGNATDWRKLLEGATAGEARAASMLWTECLDDAVGLLVWRDAEVRQCKDDVRKCDADKRVVEFGMAVLGVYVIAAGLSWLCGYW
jgi:hypothetical protein